METPKKRPLLNFVKGIFGNPLVRGSLKTVPLGSLGYEIADTIKWFKNRKKLQAEGKEVPPPPHSALSMLAQTAFLFIIIYAFLTHKLSIDDLLKWISPDDFKDFGPGGGAEITTIDSI